VFPDVFFEAMKRGPIGGFALAGCDFLDRLLVYVKLRPVLAAVFSDLVKSVCALSYSFLEKHTRIAFLRLSSYLTS
jgi:hypothetical protein